MMTLNGLSLAREIPFTHGGKDYTIRVFSNGHIITVKAFLGDNQANGYSYSVTLDVAFDMKRLRGVEALNELIKDAKRDIEEGQWEKFLIAWKANLENP